MARHEVVAGIHAVRWLLQAAPERVLAIALLRGRTDGRLDAIRDAARQHGIAIEDADATRLDRLADGTRHQGAVATVRAKPALPETAIDDALVADHPVVFLALDGIEDPRNFGAILRTADATGVDAVIVPRHRAAGLSPAARKVASGAAETVPLVTVTNLARTLDRLGDGGVTRVGLAGEATTSLFDADLRGPVCLVMGGEAKGLRRLTRERCDLLVGLPMAGVVESLNVSVAAAVALYEILRQRRSAEQPAKSGSGFSRDSRQDRG